MGSSIDYRQAQAQCLSYAANKKSRIVKFEMLQEAGPLDSCVYSNKPCYAYSWLKEISLWQKIGTSTPGPQQF